MKTIFRRLLVVSVVLYLCGTVLGGIGLGWIALHPPSHGITAREITTVQALAAADSAKLIDSSISARDGVVLKAWFFQPQSGTRDLVILLHGVSDNRLGMNGYGRWLLSKNYAVLLPDARAHGLSGGLASYGLNESDDIHLWVDWLEKNYHPRCVYALGESMGAAQLLQALAKERRFCAVVANRRLQLSER